MDKDEIDDMYKRLDEVFGFKDEEEKFDFEMLVLQSEIMLPIRDMMEKLEMADKQLAVASGIPEDRLGMLFSGDEAITLRELALFQRALKTRFKLCKRH